MGGGVHGLSEGLHRPVNAIIWAFPIRQQAGRVDVKSIRDSVEDRVRDTAFAALDLSDGAERDASPFRQLFLGAVGDSTFVGDAGAYPHLQGPLLRAAQHHVLQPLGDLPPPAADDGRRAAQASARPRNHPQRRSAGREPEQLTDPADQVGGSQNGDEPAGPDKFGGVADGVGRLLPYVQFSA